MTALGVCIGSSSVSYALTALKNGESRLLESGRFVHEGDPGKILKALFAREESRKADRIGVTGRELRHRVNLPTLSEPEALEHSYGFIRADYPARMIVSAGAETVMVYSLTREGRVTDVLTGNKCASGTGEFFLQQLRRMDLKPEDVADFADVEHPFKVSGRCSVFCKSDCTHALNKGVRREHVVAGLAEMMASKIAELIIKAERQDGNEPNPAVLLVGGSSMNKLMLAYLKRRIPRILIPPQSACFEALGASLWALGRDEAQVSNLAGIELRHSSSFKSHPSLKDSSGLVSFKEGGRRKAESGERCVLGIDVGSTTTKAVLINAEGEWTQILADAYLRTNGDPVRAARECYRALIPQAPSDIRIIGLGTTGSGRQIAGLHALTPAVINEIIAHAIGAAYYDPNVDTIFEIGGQDAKYTFLTNGVASDYAMNEACSAGTGSFLEEAARESLNAKTEDLGGIAFSSLNPTNFSDQCAAFINSDIKSAIQGGIPTQDIVAGLVYSICLNYLNRVKGSRPVGEKIFMQGGVCYNSAVPVAMAALLGKNIVVPPEPGLIGAFGVALDVRDKLGNGMLSEASYGLSELAEREVLYKESFVCAGGREKCDLGCPISRIVIQGTTYPFGGACNRYYNILSKSPEVDAAALDLVRLRERLVFAPNAHDEAATGSVSAPAATTGAAATTAGAAAETGRVPGSAQAAMGSGGAAGLSELAPSGAAAAERAGSGAIAAIAAPATGAVAAEEPRPGRTVGINRSLLTNTYYPLYRGFFEALGYRVVCPEGVHPEGVERVGAAFCYPVEVSHGTLFTLLAMKPDILFSPDVRSMNVDKSVNVKATCPFIHAESNYLLSAFPESARGPVIEPILDFAKGIESQQAVFVAIARRLGHAAAEGKAAFRAGASAQRALAKDFKSVGREFVEYLGENPHEVGIVVFGRAYNAFSSLGNKGIPHKFATRGYRIIPCDFLPFEDEENPEHMYWASGEINLKAAKFVKKHRNIFGVYITNFSCGPDSFVVDFFRKEMGSKPSLTLELDNHTADVGLDTRIEAFIDVVKSYRLLEASAFNAAAREAALKAAAISGTVVSSASASEAAAAGAAAKPYRLAETLVEKGKFHVVDSRGRKYALTDPHVHLLIPSMMDRASQAIAAVFRGVGIRADAMPDPTDKEFRIGRAYTSGKECLPIIVNAGSLVSYLRERENKDELLVYFMPGDSGPCRFGSYYVLLRNLMEKLKVEDVAFLNLSQDDGYAGLSRATTLRLWRTFIVSDVLEQVYAAILVLAADRAAALKAFDEFYDELIAGLEKDSWGKILGKLREGAKTLSEIPRKKSLKDVPHVALINEMYVRRNNFSRQFIVEKLADRGILTLVATLHEWLFYIDLMVLKKRVQHTTALRRAATAVEYPIKKMSETTIKDIFAASGFYEPKYVDTAKVLESASGLVTETLVCESILITGTTIRELVDEVDGVISIQPFGCMPGRIAESILGDKLSEKKAERAENRPLVEAVLGDFHRLPFLVVDVDGQVFPPLIEAKLEAFLLQANRIHGARIANQGEAPGAGSTFGRAASGDPSRAASGTSD